jgi:ABC-type polysaccharide/polyol phosphate transport system ATPase subunit/cephalosporin hydroxylase
MSVLLKTEHAGMVFEMVHNRAVSLKSRAVGLFNPRYREKVEHFRALKDVSIELRRGEAVALLGRNGSGKSTLLKVAAGILTPTEGAVSSCGASIGTIIELGVGFNMELTGRENVFLNAALHGFADSKIEDIYPGIVEFSGLEHFMDAPLKNYSTGMQMRLGFALEAALWPDILLIDEILAVGDGDFQAKCRARLAQYRAQGGSILLVTHSLADALNICDRGYLLEKGSIIAQGPIREVADKYSASLGPQAAPPNAPQARLSTGMENCLNAPLSSVLPLMQDRIMGKTSYFGVKAWKNPLDFWVYQELLCRHRPDVIIEIGNAFGGGTLALAHICDRLANGRIIAMDISHAHLADAAKKHPRITWMEGDAATKLDEVKKLLRPGETVLVIEDSAHTFDNTLKVLEAYAPLVTPGSYFIVEDSICRHGLDTGPAPGPYEAVEHFLPGHPEFEPDRDCESFFITWNPKGYLRKKMAAQND